MVVRKKKLAPARRTPRAATRAARAHDVAHDHDHEHDHAHHDHVDVHVLPDERNTHGFGGILAACIAVAGLALASYNITMALAIRDTAAGVFSGALLQHDITSAQPITRPPVVVAKPVVPVLWAVTQVTDAEKALLQTNLVDPIIKDAEAKGVEYSALMVERRNPISKDVNVRLFAKDGAETSYLWPSTHADDNNVWMADDAPVEIPAAAVPAKQ